MTGALPYDTIFTREKAHVKKRRVSMTGEEIKEYVHSQAELPFLERDNRGKGYICPCCGNGSGSSGDGIVKVPLSSSYKCFKCG